MTASRAEAQPLEVVERRVALALHMIELGACVFPLAQNSKKPLIPKSEGGRGFLDAKPDPAMAATFLRNPGQPNYGLAFPEGSDIIVLDLDGGDKSDHPTWREDWQRQYELYGPPGLTYIVRTPSGGRHAYYRWRTDLYGPLPPGDEMLGWTVRKPWKGYLAGPGSIVNGQTYEPAGADAIADLPEAWSRAAIAEKGPRPAASGSPIITIRGPGAVQSGHRHAYLRDQARHLVGVGVRGEALYAAVLDLNNQLREPKTPDEVRRAIGDAESKFEPDDVTPEGEPVRAAARTSRIYAEDVELAERAVQDFPEDPDPRAFAGLAGEAIESLELLTSASRVGMLTTLLAAWGGAFGTQTTYHGEQPSVLFAVLVGETGRARKGTTTSAVWSALSHALASGFISVPISTNRWDGLASGEALVRILGEAKGSDAHKPVYGLIVEEEFERLLRRMRSSEGYQSTLDTYLRQAFDARMLQHLTASKTIRVAPPYGVSILGNVTRETLRSVVSPEMARSGFANRFLWCPIVERDIEVGGSTPWHFEDGIMAQLQQARNAWVGGQHLELDTAALALLRDYAAHLREMTGLTGAMSARLHVIAARIALVHAALDRSPRVGRDLVERAIALTEYVRSGLRWSFLDADVGDEDANALYLAVLARFPDGLGTREARAVIPRSGRFAAARDLLSTNQLITLEKASTNRPQSPQTSVGGRPSVLLRAVDPGVFQRFVPRARGESEKAPETESDGLVIHVPQTLSPVRNNPLETVHKRPQTSEPDLTVLPTAATPPATWCHYQADHPFRHRDVQTSSPWCEICSPREDPA